MGWVGSVEHGFNDYDSKRYIEIMTWKSNDATTEKNFSEFVKLLELYFGEQAVLASYSNFSDVVWGWNNTSDDKNNRLIYQ